MQTIIENKYLSVGVTTAGGTLTSIKRDGREYLWQPNPEIWTGQAPICFPICGGLREGKAVTESGKQIELPRHGFARKMEFEPLNASEEKVELRLCSNSETLAKYPFDFELVARYELEGQSLRITYAVTNTGLESMPFFIGGHPAFRCPIMPGERYTDYSVRFEKPEGDVCRAVPSTGLIDVENRDPAPQDGLELCLSHQLFDFADTIYDRLKSREVVLEGLSGHGVKVKFPDFDYLVVWSKPAGDFVALEPWGGLSTCSDEDDVFEHKRGCIVAAPGQTVERSFTVQPF